MSARRHRLWQFLVVGTIIGLLSFTRGWFDQLVDGGTKSPWPILINELLASWIAAFLVWVLFLLCARVSPARLRNLPIFVAVAPLFAVMHTMGMFASRSLVYPLLGWGQYDYGSLVYRIPMEAPVQLAVYVAALGLFLYLERSEKLRETERLRTLLAETRLEALRLKLAPHFLFNALNTISSVVYDDPARADDLIGRLGVILRALLTSDSSELSTLDREFSLIAEYLAIQEARFEDQLESHLDLPGSLRDVPIPLMLLQPLVENALEHGQDATGNIGLTVSARQEADRLILEVTDGGRGPSESATDGVGLGNVRERLAAHFGSRAGLELAPTAPRGTVARIVMPCAS